MDPHATCNYLNAIVTKPEVNLETKHRILPVEVTIQEKINQALLYTSTILF